MNSRLGLFGGSFDPIHCGHLIVARSIAEQLNLDRVVLLPSAYPPHKGSVNSTHAPHRAEMTALAIQDEPLFELHDFDLCRTGPTYTIDTVQHFRSATPPRTRIHWIIGSDTLAELDSWHRVTELVELCEIVTATRPGNEAIPWEALRRTFNDKQIQRLSSGVFETPQIDVSSSEIRRRVGAGMSVRFMVPDKVADYIERQSLYRETSP